MFASSFDDLNEVIASSSEEELKVLDFKEVSNNSILNYSRNSDFLSPHYDAIKSAINTDGTYLARARNENVFSKEEQGYLDELQDAFSLLPDREVFDKEVKRIENKIVSNILDEENRFRLLATVKSSVAQVDYFFDNKAKVIEQLESHIDQFGTRDDSGRLIRARCGKGNGSSNTCCFQGDLEWNWGDFGAAIVGGAVGGATWAVFANFVPGVGQVAYGSTIIGGAVTAAGAYTGYQLTQWAFSDPCGGGNGQDCSIPEFQMFAVECQGE